MSLHDQSRPFLVAEMFGPTLQGEGPSAGRPAVFIRLSRCNLTCTWCDTSYTWDWTRFDPRSETVKEDVRDVAAWASAQAPQLVVITGGEPMLQQPVLAGLIRMLIESGKIVEIETNGTVAPSSEMGDLPVRYNVSPKLDNSGVQRDRRLVPDALLALHRTGNAVFKFVVRSVDDLTQVDEIASWLSSPDVWIMPEGITLDENLAAMRRVADAVIGRGWNLTPRLHVMLWGNERRR